jgi:hypothetical protein
VHLANIVARMIDVPRGAAADTLPPSAGARQRLGLTESALERVCLHVSRRLDEVSAQYSIAGGSVSGR